MLQEIELNKDENIHRFALTSLKGDRERERDRKKGKMRQRETKIITENFYKIMGRTKKALPKVNSRISRDKYKKICI